jgi:hypothetical protein
MLTVKIAVYVPKLWTMKVYGGDRQTCAYS